MHADPAVAIRRLVARNGLTEAQAQSRLASQMSNADRERHAQRVIVNDTDDPAVLAGAVTQVWAAFLSAHPHLA